MRSAAVVGTGLMGTSVALALSRQGIQVFLDDADTTAARTAEALGAGSLDAPDGPVDVAVLAVPPAHVGTALKECQERGLARTYTDVASVKERPYQDVLMAGGDPGRYVGGHPLAGAERSGPLAARADLFEGRLWVLTPVEPADRGALNQVLELVALCGGTPVIMDAAAHDRAVALTSHAPHLVSTLMAARLAEADGEHIRVCGQGLRDVTRIAAGEPALWGDILEANAEAVADVLEACAADMERTVAALRALHGADGGPRRRAAADLQETLRRGTRGAARVPRKHGAGPVEFATVPVAVPDQPGALARLFATVSEAGVNIEDVTIEHAVGRPTGLVELVVERSSAEEVRRLIDARGWTARDHAPLVARN
ncbi:prephenate dehydrogenase [Streptomyces sp. NPDC005930]|uniref:prephenate dehydrogenase n=1 Tax=Streptomyces sp. NPDC005930 TaxID=3364736 RepID=UPI0036B75B77